MIRVHPNLWHSRWVPPGQRNPLWTSASFLGLEMSEHVHEVRAGSEQYQNLFKYHCLLYQNKTQLPFSILHIRKLKPMQV